jgi:hypothetical protein
MRLHSTWTTEAHQRFTQLTKPARRFLTAGSLNVTDPAVEAIMGPTQNDFGTEFSRDHSVSVSLERSVLKRKFGNEDTALQNSAQRIGQIVKCVKPRVSIMPWPRHFPQRW